MAGIIQVSGYKNEYIAGKLGMTRQNFATKKKRNSWTPEEMEKILNVIHNEDVEDAIMVHIMESRANEPNIPISELKQEFGKTPG